MRVDSSSPCPSNGETAVANKSAKAASTVFIAHTPTFLDRRAAALIPALHRGFKLGHCSLDALKRRVLHAIPRQAPVRVQPRPERDHRLDLLRALSKSLLVTISCSSTETPI